MTGNVSVVDRWYEWWEKSGYFVADPHSKKPPFVIVSLTKLKRLGLDSASPISDLDGVLLSLHIPLRRIITATL